MGHGNARTDDGLFGPGSVTWRVHAEHIMWVAGIRALYLQSLHPRVMRGTFQNSVLFDRKKAWARFLRTADFVAVRTYGTTAEVERAASRVRAIHASLTGYDPDTDTVFRLDEPEHLLWVHCGEIDSYVNISLRSGLLNAQEADEYVAESRRAAEVIGIHYADAPATCAELADYFAMMRPKLYACIEARRGLLNSFNPPLPVRLAPLRLAVPSINVLAFASLPRWARRMYGVLTVPTTDLAVSLSLRTLRQATMVLPRPAIPAQA
ncbi:oxygenase MpaB family protein [Actinopolymorpha alba]|uniref:oxygenase MpaB family protein n=1 Tax=Actinopolymorpha alba TaxID=533267 RepID=UPI0003747D51|nr:oxygenase MpaB family protein [Actinopolymorpha alba]